MVIRAANPVEHRARFGEHYLGMKMATKQKAVRVSPAMRLVLENIAAGREPFCHTVGKSAHGGATGTAIALRRHELVTADMKQLTEKGRAALRA